MTSTVEKVGQRTTLSLGRARVWVNPDQRQDRELLVNFSANSAVLLNYVEPVIFVNTVSTFFKTVSHADDILRTMLADACIQIIMPPENTLDYNEVFRENTIDLAYTLFCQVYPVYSRLYPETWCNDGYYESDDARSWRFAQAATTTTVRDFVETAFGVYTKPLVRHVVNHGHVALSQAIVFNYLIPHEWLPDLRVSPFYGGEFLEKDIKNAKDVLSPSLVKKISLHESSHNIDDVYTSEYFSLSEIFKIINCLDYKKGDEKILSINSWYDYQKFLDILIAQEKNGKKFNYSNFKPIADIEINGYSPNFIDSPNKLIDAGYKADNCLKETRDYLHKAYSGDYCYITWGDVSTPEGIIAEVMMKSNSGYQMVQIFHRENKELNPSFKKEITDKIESL